MLVGATLPGTLRVSEVHRQPSLFRQQRMCRELFAAVPGQRTAQLLRQMGDRLRQSVFHGQRPIPRQCRAVLRWSNLPVPGLAGQVDQYRVAGGALDQRGHGRTLQPDDQVTFPVPGDLAVLDLRGTLLKHRLRSHVRPGLLAGSRSRRPFGPASAQVPGLLALKPATALNVERLVDRLMGDPHRLILREVQGQAPSDLLRAPAGDPLPVPAVRFVLSTPDRPGGADDLTFGGDDFTAELVLDVLA